jgi:hypothetical protein
MNTFNPTLGPVHMKAAIAEIDLSPPWRCCAHAYVQPQSTAPLPSRLDTPFADRQRWAGVLEVFGLLWLALYQSLLICPEIVALSPSSVRFPLLFQTLAMSRTLPSFAGSAKSGGSER